MAESLFRCDAIMGKVGSPRGCKHRAAVQIVTTRGTVLNYCDKHRKRVDDPVGKHHSPISAIYKIKE